MKIYLIDTSVIIDYLKGKEKAYILLHAAQGNFTSSYFCLAELYEGISHVRETEKHEKEVQRYFGSLSHIYGLDLKIVKKFGELRARLKRAGNVIEDIDLFIAATCIVYELTLITFNTRHFSRIKELALYK